MRLVEIADLCYDRPTMGQGQCIFIFVTSVLFLSSCGRDRADWKTSRPVSPLTCAASQEATLKTRSYEAGLCIENSLYVRVFVGVPYKAEFVNVADMHNPVWFEAGKVWGLAINDDNRRLTQVDEWPPDSAHDDWYKKTYGMSSAELYRYWGRSVIPHPGSNAMGVRLTHDCAHADLEIDRRWEDSCQTNEAPPRRCAGINMTWGGPGDVDLNGTVNQADRVAFDADPYDFDLDGKVSATDSYVLTRTIEAAQKCR